MVGPLHSLDLVVNRMLNANSLFKFTMSSHHLVDFFQNSISFQYEHWEAFLRLPYTINRNEKKTLFVIVSIEFKTNNNRISFIMIPKKALLASAVSLVVDQYSTQQQWQQQVQLYIEQVFFRTLPFDYEKKTIFFYLL